MISPSMFHQIVLPRLQRLTSKLSVPCILHICGDTSSLLEAMGQTGAKVLSLDQCMSLSESRAIAPKAVLGGNVDPVNSLLMGTKEQVMADTLNCLCTGGTNRFIFPFARFKTFAFQANSFSMFRILNIEYRIRNFEQKKFFK